MASTTPVVGLDEWNKDGRQVEEFNMSPLKKNRADPPMKDKENTPWTPAEEHRLKAMRAPWTPAEEHRLKAMRDAGNSWEEISKTFPRRTEESIKKHWYKDLHFAEFSEDDSASLMAAIKEYEASKLKVIEQKVGKLATSAVLLAAMNEYEASKWNVIGQKVGKPAKACEQYAREQYACEDASDNQRACAKGGSSMSFLDSDEPFTRERVARVWDEMPADASNHPKRQKISDYDHPKRHRDLKYSVTAQHSPFPQDHYSSDLELPTVSRKYRLIAPRTLSSMGRQSPPGSPVAAKDTAVKSEGKFEPTLRGNEDMLSDDSMDVIKTTVLRETERLGKATAILHMPWNPVDFMKTQYPDNGNAKLGSVITISGTVLRAQATTCSEYAQKTWPVHGLNVIMAFQNAISSSSCTSEVSSTDLYILVDVISPVCVLNISSTKAQTIVEVVQQAIWMGAALRVSRVNRVQYSTFNLETDTTISILPEFRVTFKSHNLSKEEEESCWLPIFQNPVIARGFPVPERENGEQGLEIPLEIMAALGGARHVTEYQGGLVLKGFSAMFVPIKGYDKSLQWHLIKNRDDQRILYRELSSGHPKRALVEEVDHQSLWNTRAFLGWWKSAEIHLGTEGAAYNDIDWSSAGEARRLAKFSGANIGFQTMITGQLEFIMGAKDGRLHFSQKGPFQRIVQCAENTLVVLYDIEDHRAWLVPALGVMLHIVQTRHHISPYKICGKDVTLAPVNPKGGKHAAEEAVMANQRRQLYLQDNTAETKYHHGDAILDLWSQIERLMEKEDSIGSETGLALHGTMQSKICGWEYMSLVHEKNYRRKESAIAKTSGGWVDLVNDIDALVLFATGLGNIIKPVTDLSDLDGLCPSWRNLPKGKDYLATCVSMMELLYSEAGSRRSHKHLSTSHLQWHRGSTLFEQCSGTFSGRCECDRTQQIYHDSLFKTFGRVRPPGNLERMGCVVFGQSRHPFKPTKAIPMRQNAVHILPNTSIQNGRTTPQTHAKDDGLISPVPPASISPEPKDFDDYATRNSKRPLSPLSSSDGLVQEAAITSKRRRRTSITQMSNVDTFKGPKDEDDEISQSNDCAPNTLNYLWKPGHIDYCNEQHSGYRKTEHDSEAEIAPVDVGRTLRHKSRIGRLQPLS